MQLPPKILGALLLLPACDVGQAEPAQAQTALDALPLVTSAAALDAAPSETEEGLGRELAAAVERARPRTFKPTAPAAAIVPVTEDPTAVVPFSEDPSRVEPIRPRDPTPAARVKRIRPRPRPRTPVATPVPIVKEPRQWECLACGRG